MIWKCKLCDYSAGPTIEGYRKVAGHQIAHSGIPKKKRRFQLIDESTGEILAGKLDEAIAKGFIAPELKAPGVEVKPLEPQGEAKPLEPQGEAKPLEPQVEVKPLEPQVEVKPLEPQTPSRDGSQEGVERTTIRTAGIFTYEITLPADAFTLYNLAKACELEEDDKSFDEWIWDCVRARYAKDYKKQLILAPLEDDDGNKG